MGILNPLYDAVSWIILQFHKLFSPIFGEDSGWAWGLSIVFLVVVIRIALIPLFVKQIKATRNLQAIQPRIKEIQKRYKDDRERQSQEMMKLYKETGTNPFSSCLPILVQSPFFFALFHVLNRISQGKTVGVINDQATVDSAREAHIFGAPIAAKFTDSAAKIADLGADLSTVRVVTIVMIVLMSLSQFITQRQLMLKNTDPASLAGNPFAQQQKILMYVFPVMFAVFGINFPVGVLVYWLTTNLWTMGQQLYVINRNPTPGSVAYQARQKRLEVKAKKHGKVLLPDGTLITQEEFDQREAEEKARAARRVQPTRTTKSKRKTTGHQPGETRPTVKGSTVRTPPTANGTAATPAEEETGDQETGDQEASGDSGDAAGAGSGGRASGGRQQPRSQSRARRQQQGRKKS